MTTNEQDTGLDPGTREVDYRDIVYGMLFLCGDHVHEILSVKAYAPGPAGNGKHRRARKVLTLSDSYVCHKKEWTCEPGDAIICAEEPNTDAVDTQPIAVLGKAVTHQIPARDVVPGLLLAPGWDIVDVRREGGDILVAWRDRDVGDACHYEPDDPVSVHLPGPSPRELCCSCDVPRWMIGPLVGSEIAISKFKARDPGQYPAGCPVSPVTWLHGGLRLWPAPWRGEAWVYNADRREYRCDGHSVWLDDITDVGQHGVDGQLCTSIRRRDEWILQSLYLPPVSSPRILPGASLDDPDLERVADLVSGGVIGPVRR